MKEKAIKKQSFLNRKKAEWKEMKLWNADCEGSGIYMDIVPDPDGIVFYLCTFGCETDRKQIFPDV